MPNACLPSAGLTAAALAESGRTITSPVGVEVADPLLSPALLPTTEPLRTSLTAPGNPSPKLTGSGLTCTRLTRAGLARAGLARAGVTWAGLTRAGLARAGLARAGVTCTGRTWAGLARAGLT